MMTTLNMYPVGSTGGGKPLIEDRFHEFNQNLMRQRYSNDFNQLYYNNKGPEYLDPSSQLSQPGKLFIAQQSQFRMMARGDPRAQQNLGNRNLADMQQQSPLFYAHQDPRAQMMMNQMYGYGSKAIF